jgi:hypothetical protein
MTKLALVSALMPVAKLLIDKIFDLFKGATDTYNNSEKTKDDLDKLLGTVKKGISDPEFLAIAKKLDPSFELSGKIDTPEEMNKLADLLEKMVEMTPSSEDDAKLESIISTLRSVADDLAAAGGIEGADKGDMKIDFVPDRALPPGHAYFP